MTLLSSVRVPAGGCAADAAGHEEGDVRRASAAAARLLARAVRHRSVAASCAIVAAACRGPGLLCYVWHVSCSNLSASWSAVAALVHMRLIHQWVCRLCLRYCTSCVEVENYRMWYL
jgi:hypothetical protein